jgi:hypothetical protein
MSFGHQQCDLEVGITTVTAHAPAGGDHTVIWQSGLHGFAKNVADGTSCARPPGQPRNLTISRDAPRRNLAQHVQHAAGEWRDHYLAAQ